MEVGASRQKAAEKYRPDDVRVLLVAEAPPANDERYFYFEDVASNDWLFLGVAEVVFGHKPGRVDKAASLARLQGMGFFLIDLKLDPADDAPLQSFVPGLLARCRALAPERIILIKATVFDVAFQPLRSAGHPVVNQRVYFPSTGRQPEFREQFAAALGAGVPFRGGTPT
jgi:hypothetical protein